MTISPALFFFLIGFSFAAAVVVFLLIITKNRTPKTADITSLQHIHTELEKLNRMFTVPHIRGGIGETMLEELLHTWLADSMYRRQYSFKSGERADAVIFLGDFLIAVDSKFPLEAIRGELETGLERDGGRVEASETPAGEFPSAQIRRNIGKHVQDIASKYIRPEEGTLQFALMYIPSEKIYYHLFVDGGGTLYEEALRMGVVPVSPSSIFLYIQTIVFGLRGLSFSGANNAVAGALFQARKDFTDYVKIHNVMGTHIKNLIKSYEEGIRKLTKLEHSIDMLENIGKEKGSEKGS